MPRPTFSQRILLALGAVFVSAVAVSSYIAVSMRQLDLLSTEEATAQQAADAAHDLQVEALQVMLVLRRYRDTADRRLVEELESARSSAARSREDLRVLTQHPEVLAALDEYDRLLPDRVATADVIVAAVADGRDDAELTTAIARREELDVQAIE